ncbi:MAG: hypothetical protein WDN46_20370 [Methylocella sp.]
MVTPGGVHDAADAGLAQADRAARDSANKMRLRLLPAIKSVFHLLFLRAFFEPLPERRIRLAIGALAAASALLALTRLAVPALPNAGACEAYGATSIQIQWK